MNKKEVKRFFNKAFGRTGYSFDIYKTETGYTVLLTKGGIPIQIIGINKKLGLKASLEEYLKGLQRILTIDELVSSEFQWIYFKIKNELEAY